MHAERRVGARSRHLPRGALRGLRCDRRDGLRGGTSSGTGSGAGRAAGQAEAGAGAGKLGPMSTDEDALRWEGDDELEGLALADGESADDAAGGDQAADDATDGDDAARADASAPVVPEDRTRGPLCWLMLVLALAATAGWILIIVANPVQQPSLIGLAMYQLGELLAVLTPLLWWFCADRLAPLRRRSAWWFAGLVVTAPWPLVVGVLA